MMACTSAEGVVSLTMLEAITAAVAQHGDPVGDAEHFVEPVGDVDQAHPLRAQAAQHVEQARDIGLGQCRGGLVEHQHVGSHRERAGDGDDRLAGRRQAAHAHFRCDPAAHAIEHVCGGLLGAAPVDQSAAARVAGNQRDVLGDRHAVHQSKLLVDEGDRQPLGIGLHGAGLPPYLARVGAMHAGQHFYQRGFAGAVLAEQRMDFAGVERGIHAVERQRAAEPFRQAANLQQGRRLGHRRRPAAATSRPRAGGNAAHNCCWE